MSRKGVERARIHLEILGQTREIEIHVPPAMIPLVLALEWSEAHGALLDRRVDGEAVFWTIVELLGREGRRPFLDRGEDGGAMPGAT